MSDEQLAHDVDKAQRTTVYGWVHDYALDLQIARARIADLERENVSLREIARVLNEVAVPRPVSDDRKSIVEAVEFCIKKNDIDATADVIAWALLEAAVKAGWILPPPEGTACRTGEGSA